MTCAEMKGWRSMHFLEGLGIPLENFCIFELQLGGGNIGAGGGALIPPVYMLKKALVLFLRTYILESVPLRNATSMFSR